MAISPLGSARGLGRSGLGTAGQSRMYRSGLASTMRLFEIRILPSLPCPQSRSSSTSSVYGLTLSSLMVDSSIPVWSLNTIL